MDSNGCNAIIEYIVSNFKKTDKNFEAIESVIKRQQKINKQYSRYMWIFGLIALVRIGATSSRISKLEREMDKIKQPEGE